MNYTHQHKIPVPKGKTPEEAWEEIKEFGMLFADPLVDDWQIIECGGRCDPSTVYIGNQSAIN